MLCAGCGEATGQETCGRCGRPAVLEGRYRLEELLGSDGRTTMYRAVRLSDGLACAVKRMPLRRSVDDDALRRIRREATVLRQLRHRGIPRYYEDFEAGDARRRDLWLVQEYVPGRTLAEEAAERRPGEADVLAVLEGLLSTLAYLHGLSPPVVHHDVKPANVVRHDGDGRLVLVDFGGVREAVREADLGGFVAGTFGYMAPEAVQGRGGPRSDLYAVGALAVALLTGREPRDLLDANGAIAWREAVDVLPGTALVLDQLLERDPAARVESADRALSLVRVARTGAQSPSTVGAALEQAVSSNAGVLPSAATPVPAARRGRTPVVSPERRIVAPGPTQAIERRRRRNRYLAVGGAAVLAVLGALGLLSAGGLLAWLAW